MCILYGRISLGGIEGAGGTLPCTWRSAGLPLRKRLRVRLER